MAMDRWPQEFLGANGARCDASAALVFVVHRALPRTVAEEIDRFLVGRKAIALVQHMDGAAFRLYVADAFDLGRFRAVA